MYLNFVGQNYLSTFSAIYIIGKNGFQNGEKVLSNAIIANLLAGYIYDAVHIINNFTFTGGCTGLQSGL